MLNVAMRSSRNRIICAVVALVCLVANRDTSLVKHAAGSRILTDGSQDIQVPIGEQRQVSDESQDTGDGQTNDNTSDDNRSDDHSKGSSADNNDVESDPHPSPPPVVATEMPVEVRPEAAGPPPLGHMVPPTPAPHALPPYIAVKPSSDAVDEVETSSVPIDGHDNSTTPTHVPFPVPRAASGSTLGSPKKLSSSDEGHSGAHRTGPPTISHNKNNPSTTLPPVAASIAKPNDNSSDAPEAAAAAAADDDSLPTPQPAQQTTSPAAAQKAVESSVQIEESAEEGQRAEGQFYSEHECYYNSIYKDDNCMHEGFCVLAEGRNTEQQCDDSGLHHHMWVVSDMACREENLRNNRCTIPPTGDDDDEKNTPRPDGMKCYCNTEPFATSCEHDSLCVKTMELDDMDKCKYGCGNYDYAWVGSKRECQEYMKKKNNCSDLPEA